MVLNRSALDDHRLCRTPTGRGFEYISHREMARRLKQFCDDNGLKDVPLARFRELRSRPLYGIYLALLDGQGTPTALGKLPRQFISILKRSGYDVAEQLSIPFAVHSQPAIQ